MYAIRRAEKYFFYYPEDSTADGVLEVGELPQAWTGNLNDYTITVSGTLLEIGEMSANGLENYKQKLRKRRKNECFPIINRGKLWYDSLSAEQTNELSQWYSTWLNVTDTLIIPPKPQFIE